MKRSRIACAWLILVAVFSLAFSTGVFAQAAASEARVVQIRKIDPLKVRTPEYQLARGGYVARTRDWFQITTTYKTAPDWLDELTFTYYILVKGKEAGSKFTLFRGEVTYVNVQRGDHKSDMYLHPSTLARYGDVERVAVVVGAQGRIVAMESLPPSQTRWWEQLTPVDGYALNRMQTPFAMVNFDDYEAVKATGPSR